MRRSVFIVTLTSVDSRLYFFVSPGIQTDGGTFVLALLYNCCCSICNSKTGERQQHSFGERRQADGLLPLTRDRTLRTHWRRRTTACMNTNPVEPDTAVRSCPKYQYAYGAKGEKRCLPCENREDWLFATRAVQVHQPLRHVLLKDEPFDDACQRHGTRDVKR